MHHRLACSIQLTKLDKWATVIPTNIHRRHNLGFSQELHFFVAPPDNAESVPFVPTRQFRWGVIGLVQPLHTICMKASCAVRSFAIGP